MAAWSDGYFTDVQYTSQFYSEMAPGYMAFACLRQGVRPPRLGPGSTYLELGCGQGFGLSLLAAANPGMSFWGVDFHPAQIANARRLAGDAGLSNVTFDDFSFEQMLSLPKDQLPKCDVIALHGVYTWVNAENRGFIVRILDRLLNPGGIAYVSYNCLPGWAPLVPLQRFIAEHVAQTPGDPQTQVVAALKAALQMLDADGGYFGSAPSIRPRIEEALSGTPAYLIHEYLHDGSEPLFHADVARELDGARLAFAASGNIADDLVHLAAPAALQPVILAAQDPTWRETLLDYASNKLFRRDIFVRGRNALARLERDALLDGMRLALLAPPDAITFEFQIPIGRLTGRPSLYRGIVDALADGPKTYGELCRLPPLAALPDGAVLQAVTLLIGARHIHPLADAAAAAEASVAFNRARLARGAFDDFPKHLASAATGTGVRVEFADVLAISALLGEETPAEAARRGWEMMTRTGVRLLKDGEKLTDQAGNEAELAARIAAFAQTRLPLFRSLGMI